MRYAAVLLALLCALPVIAVPHHVTAAADLGAQVASLAHDQSNAVIRWSVAAIPGTHIGCWNDDETSADDKLVVELRTIGGKVDRIRALSPHCNAENDAPLTILDDVTPTASVNYVATLIRHSDSEVAKHAVTVLALHADPSATAPLAALAADAAASDQLRGDAAFWLASSRGHAGYEAARALARDGRASEHLREKAVFAISNSNDAASLDDLIDIARNDPNAATRGRALFWLSQRAGKRAAAALRDAADHDADSHIKDQAVFGISQLANDVSIPLLSDLARTSSSPAVRKKAAFWLGQKDDPRAVAALEDLLKR